MSTADLAQAAADAVKAKGWQDASAHAATLAFQKSWNVDAPNVDPPEVQLTEDGEWGPMTSSAAGRAGVDSPPAAYFSPSSSSRSASGSGAASSPAWSRTVATAAAALRASAQKHGVTLSTDLLRMMLGQVAAESAFGVSGSLGGTNNWGAYQASTSWGKTHASDAGYGAIAHLDTSPVAGPYIGFYRVLPSQQAAADDWFAQWGVMLAKADPQTPADYSKVLYQHGYFEGTHPTSAEKANGMAVARPIGQRSDPLTDAEQENVDAYANFVSSHMPSVAAVDPSAAHDDPSAQKVGPFAPLTTRLRVSSLSDAASLFATALRSSWGSWLSTLDALNASSGVVWFTGKAPPGLSGGSSTAAKALSFVAIATVTLIGLGLAAVVLFATHKGGSS